MSAGEAKIELPEPIAGFRACRCYVENAARGIVLAAEKGRPGEAYNVADEWVLTEREWYRRIAGLMHWSGELVVVLDSCEQHIVLDTAKIRGDLQYKEPVPVDGPCAAPFGGSFAAHPEAGEKEQWKTWTTTQ